MGSIFVYTVRDDLGHLKRGKLAAANRDVLVKKLVDDGLHILEIRQNLDPKVQRPELRLGKQVKNRELMLLARQFGIMLRSGMPLRRCLLVIQEQTANYYLQKSTARVIADVEHGMPFWKALQRQPRIFPRFFIYMVKGGEMSGTLGEVLNYIAVYLEQQDQLASKLKKAMAYPMVVGFFTVAVVIFMLVFIMPEFTGMYQNTAAELPWITRLVISVGSMVKIGLPWAAGCIVMAAIVLIKVRAIEKGRQVLDSLLLRLPLIGFMVSQMAAAQFSRTMGILLASGVPLLGAIEVSGDLLGNAWASQQMVKTGLLVEEGNSLAGALKASMIFDPMAVQIISVGEETGTLPEAFLSVADYHDNDVTYQLDFIVSLIEPALILFLAFIVGGIVIACMLPMMQMSTMIG